jgi:hypothetical protein
MPALNKAAILAADDVKVEKVNVPEWGGDVFIKTLSGTDRDAFEDAYSREKMKNFRARFLVLTLCDDKGGRLFTDSEIEEVGRKSSIVINRLFDKAWSFNAFTPAEVEELGKDSQTDQNGGSTSG